MSLAPERIDRGQASGTGRRIDAEHHADADRHRDGGGGRGQGEDHTRIDEHWEQDRADHSEADTEQTSGETKYRCLDEELSPDEARSRAQCLAESDLANSFRDRNQHDV